MKKILSRNLGKLAFLSVIIILSISVIGSGFGAWSDSIRVNGNISISGTDLGGTPGFWKNWGSHTEFSRNEIQDFLYNIDAASDWLIPDLNQDCGFDITDMEIVFLNGESHGTMEQRFLSSYLATRLNVESGRLLVDPIRDFRSYNLYNYLGLNDFCSLSKIIEALENKHDSFPAEEQFELMKNICDGLNNLEISLKYD